VPGRKSSPSEECETTKAFGPIEGGNQTPDRLDDYLAKMPAN